MSKTAIVKTGEQFFIRQLSNSQPIKLDQVIFANINGINGDTEIDLNGSMPTPDQIVHAAPVTQAGLLNDKTVVYSVILDTNVGDFSFNYIGLVNAETNTLCMVMHTDLTKKIRTAGQRQGNTITESIWLEIDNASESTGIIVNAETWQIDYSKRLAGADERIRLTNYDLYDRLVIQRGLAITKNGNQLTVALGVAYVAGLRVELNTDSTITIENNQSLYFDAWLAGTVTGEWITHYNLIVGTNLRDYHDGNFQHYVERIASVDPNGYLVVVNPKSYVTTYDHASTEKWGIIKLNSSTNSDSQTEAATPLAVKTAYERANVANANAISANSNANEAHKNIQTLGGRIADVEDKFTSSGMESRVYSHDKRYLFVVRDDGIAGMYDTAKNTFVWLFTDTGWIDGYIMSSRVGGLDQFVRDRCVPVGAPIPWPTPTPPDGWVKCNGWQFDKNKYPRLAVAYPSGFLPDIRGDFIRGWDDGRGADPGREILSWQPDAIRNITGTFAATDDNRKPTATTGAFATGAAFGNGSGGSAAEYLINFDASRVVPVSHDNHPRNIAYLYIVRAE